MVSVPHAVISFKESSIVNNLSVDNEGVTRLLMMNCKLIKKAPEKIDNRFGLEAVMSPGLALTVNWNS